MMAQQPEKSVDPSETERPKGSPAQPAETGAGGAAGSESAAPAGATTGGPGAGEPADATLAAEAAAFVGEAGLSAEDLVPGLGAAVAAEEIDQLTQQVAALEAERDDLRDKLMRALAETENVRRRADRDRRDAETYAGTKLARDLLTVHDNLERAMAAADEALKTDHTNFLEGVELTARELLNAFAKHKIAPVRPEKGERFDPNRHQAMFEAPIPGAEPKTIIEVMQPGFVIADRLLRPALVGVAKAMPTQEPAAPDPKPGETDGGTDSEAEPKTDDNSGTA